jgi:hypothetical protein
VHQDHKELRVHKEMGGHKEDKELKDLSVVKGFKVHKAKQLLVHQVPKVLKETLVTKVEDLLVLQQGLKVLKGLQVLKELKDKVEVQVQRVLKELKELLVLQVGQAQSDHHRIQG